MEVSVKRTFTLSPNDSKLQELLTINPQIYPQIYPQVKKILFTKVSKTKKINSPPKVSKYISLVNIFFNFPQPGKNSDQKKRR